MRERTLSLVSGLEWSVLEEQHIPILSPMVWDLGHIAHFEELWLCQNLAGLEPLKAEFAQLFDAVLNPRPTRKDLPLPMARTLWDYLSRVRTRALEVLRSAPDSQGSELLDRGFVYELVAEHEEQHQETLLQLLQILESPSYLPAQRRSLPLGRAIDRQMVLIPAGPFLMGSDRRSFAYDNELAMHEVDLPAFRIDRAPVSCGRYLEFVEDQGYRRRDLWSAPGWAWRDEAGLEAPGNWYPSEGSWRVRHMDRTTLLDEGLPVIHVTYYEAEAFARWAGRRLPSEAEWEKAALWDPDLGRSRLYPWGDQPPSRRRANLD